MKKTALVILSLFIVLYAAPVHAADDEDTDTKLHLRYAITPEENLTGKGFYCENQTLFLDVTNPYTKRPVKDVLVQVFCNVRTKIWGGFTPYTGRIQFVPNMSGSYIVYMSRTGYYDERAYFDVSICTTTTTSTTSTTEATTTSTTSTTTTTTSTTTVSTSTTLAPTCDDGLRNQGEDGVDCGGPCGKACLSLNFTLFFGAVVALFMIAFAAYILSKRAGGKPKYEVVSGAPQKEAEKKEKHKHRHKEGGKE